MLDLIKAAFLGVLEGLTEFLPVSSTGHLLLVGHFLGFDDADFGKTFVVLIQLGAILAILTLYFGRLWRIAMALPYDVFARRFVIGVVIAFIPAAVIGYLARGFIKGTLFNPWVVCVSLIVGGFILLWVDRQELAQKFNDAMRFPLLMYLGIGLAQCVAMIPGVSRSGSTIVAAMLMGSDKRSAAEFSFFLAIPTMVGAFALDLLKSYDQLSSNNVLLVAVGFVTSFIAGWIVVRSLLDYVAQHGFAVFAWWRILVGAVGLIGLALLG